MGARLVYCWVDKFRALNDIDINLTNDFHFHYDKEKGLLNVEKSDFPRVFEQIRPVKAIVGRNGCGKSSYLEIVEHTLLTGRNDYGFCVLEKSEDNEIVFEVQLMRSDISIQYQSKGFEAKFCDRNKPFRISRNKMGLVTFCNRSVSSIQRRTNKSRNYIDISTRPLAVSNKVIDDFEFYCNSGKKTTCYLSFVVLDVNALDFMDSKSKVFCQNIITAKYPELGSNSFFSVVLASFFRQIMVRKSLTHLERYIRDFFKKEESEQEFKDYLEHFSTVIDTGIIGKYLNSNFIEDSFGCRFRFGMSELSEIREFQRLKNAIPRGFQQGNSWNRLFVPKIEGLSSGEEHFLHLERSLLGDASKGVFSNCESVILLFDEPESHLHPEWQRCFLSQLLSVLSRVNKSLNDDVKYQVITTTHSPFLISDLLDENVTFLPLMPLGEREIKKTFATNIHSFLLNDFFMEKTIGELASELILEAVNYIKTSTPGKYVKSPSDCEQLIACISNVAVKSEMNKLLDQYQIGPSKYRLNKKRLIKFLEDDDFESFEKELRKH
ncbi:AAA family ATPase [Vibrio harveyi]|uniref:AAA family ATPase n=1 Tax=Vibrio harveyi TaxID=669 RepID=UPI0024816A66|nr:AAA family ATPase [Vibrio harveyi]